jgi:hypothetical protein
LGDVDVSVRADDLVSAFRLAQDFKRAISDYLVGIHVDGSSGTPLDRVDDELIIELTGDYIVSGARDCVCNHRL